MFKHGRMQKKTSSQLAPMRYAYIDCMLSGVQVTTGMGFFCIQVIIVIAKIVTSCFHRPSLLSRSVQGKFFLF